MNPPIKDRSAKVDRRKRRMPVNGIAFKRLLIERAIKSQPQQKKGTST
jgi:hypothetical protein